MLTPISFKRMNLRLVQEPPDADAGADAGAELENPCPICMDNEDDACVGGGFPKNPPKMCSGCGQSVCGSCAADWRMCSQCPICRAPRIVSDKKEFKRMWKLVHDRPTGRHTPIALFCIARMYSTGSGVPKDDAKAVQFFTLAADKDFAEAMVFLAGLYKEGRGGVQKDAAKSNEYFIRAADLGKASAQVVVGNLYCDGDGVALDFAQGFKYFKMAAEQGDAYGQTNVGISYLKGEGVRQNTSEAIKWYKLAAAQGDLDAIRMLKLYGVL